MELHQRIREAFRDCVFRAPATDDQVRRVERELGVTLPEDVQRLYLHYDGFHTDGEHHIELLPLVGPEQQAVGKESVLSWNLFRRGPGWEEGCEPPKHVLELGFLNDDEYVGIDLRTGQAVVVFRRGNEVEPAGKELGELLIGEYQEQRRFAIELHEQVFKGRVVYRPPPEGERSDVDRVLSRYVELYPAAWFLKELTETPGDRGGVWILSVGFEPKWEQIRIKSPTGDFPVVVESDVSDLTLTARTVDAVVATIRAELDRYHNFHGFGPKFVE